MRLLALLAAVLAVACGRSDLFRPEADVIDGGMPSHDAGSRDAGTDAGPADAGAHDAGPTVPLCAPPSPDAGFVAGATPLGDVDFRSVWVGTESPTTHSCPHFTVLASHGPTPSETARITVDFHRAPVPGPNTGHLTLTLGGKTAQRAVDAFVSRADGLDPSGRPRESWRTSVQFTALDGGWNLRGAVFEAPDCSWATWFCI